VALDRKGVLTLADFWAISSRGQYAVYEHEATDSDALRAEVEALKAKVVALHKLLEAHDYYVDSAGTDDADDAFQKLNKARLDYFTTLGVMP